MKLYTITRGQDSKLSVFVETNVVKDRKGRDVAGYLKYLLPPADAKKEFAIGEATPEAGNLALSIMADYYGVKPADLAAATPEAVNATMRREAFLTSFLVHHQMQLGATYEISSEVMDRWMATWRAVA
jgi:hypothetical protein